MIKFSTKTNYQLVQIAHLFVTKALRFTKSDISKVSVKRGGINWELNLNEVIDFLIFLAGSFDKASIQAITQKIKPDDVVLDVGANIGSMSLHIAKSLSNNGRIYSIEPSSYAYKRLQKNVAINATLSKRVQTIHAFIKDDSCDMPNEVYASWDMSSQNKRHENHQGILTKTEGATALSIDEVVEQYQIDKLDWIKIDIDGYEEHALRGSTETLKNFLPNILIELSEYTLIEYGSSVDKVLDILFDNGYYFYSVSNKYLGQDKDKIKQQIPKMGAINVFAYAQHPEG